MSQEEVAHIAGKPDITISTNAPKEDENEDIWPTPWGEVAKHFEENSDNGESLDIYQMCAFLSNNCASRSKRYFYYFKAICCMLFQTVGLVIFILNAIKDTNKGLCEQDGDWDVRTIAVISSAYISFTMGSMVQVMDHQGLYEFDGWSTETVPPFIGPRWLFIGIYTNYFSLVGAIIGSFIVIYVSESALDVLLNAVALFFVVELDDLMVDEYDYKRINEFFASWDYKEYPQPHKMTKCQKRGIFCGGITVILAVLISMLGAVAAPFYMAICF